MKAYCAEISQVVVIFVISSVLVYFYFQPKQQHIVHRSATIYADIFPEEYGDSTVITTLFLEVCGDTFTVEKAWQSQTILGFDNGQSRLASLADSVVAMDSCRVQIICDGGMRKTKQFLHFGGSDMRSLDSVYWRVQHFYFDSFGAEGNGY